MDAMGKLARLWRANSSMKGSPMVQSRFGRQHGKPLELHRLLFLCFVVGEGHASWAYRHGVPWSGRCKPTIILIKPMVLENVTVLSAELLVQVFKDIFAAE